MDTRYFKYIMAISEHLSISKAAEALFISQPHLSKVLLRIESELDVLLFERSRHPLKPTVAGELFLSFCRRYKDIENEFKTELRKLLSSASYQLNVGAPPIRGSYWLPIVLPLFKKAYPNVEVTINEFASNQIPVRIAEGEVDLGVFAWPATRKDLVYERLFDERMLLMVPANHPLAYPTSRKISNRILTEKMLPLLEGENFISIDTPQSITHSVITYLHEHGVHSHINITAKNNVTTYRLCERGMGLAIIMEAAACNTVFYENPCFYQIGEVPLIETWYVAYRKGTQLSLPVQYFLQLVHKHVPNVLNPRHTNKNKSTE